MPAGHNVGDEVALNLKSKYFQPSPDDESKMVYAENDCMSMDCDYYIFDAAELKALLSDAGLLDGGADHLQVGFTVTAKRHQLDAGDGPEVSNTFFECKDLAPKE